jgi:hypothetical protein
MTGPNEKKKKKKLTNLRISSGRLSSPSQVQDQLQSSPSNLRRLPPCLSLHGLLQRATALHLHVPSKKHTCVDPSPCVYLSRIL